MYFCPCPPVDSANLSDNSETDEEEKTVVSLPRNLSYVSESYLDKYSVSSAFVHNPKLENLIRHEQEKERETQTVREVARLLSSVTHLELNSDQRSERNSDHRPELSSGHKLHSQKKLKVGEREQVPSDRECRTPHCDGAACPCHLPTRLKELHGASPFFNQHKEDGQEDAGVKEKVSVSSSLPTSYLSSTSLFPPLAKVASRLSAFLHAPPNESMDLHRGPDPGTSVDAVNSCSAGASSAPLLNPGNTENPDNHSPVIDRCVDDCVERASSTSENLKSAVIRNGTKFDDEASASGSPPPDSNLFPKPIGGAGKTFFPRQDLSWSDISDQDDMDTKDVQSNHVSNQTGAVSMDASTSDVKCDPADVQNSRGATYGSPDSDVGVFFNMDDVDNEKSASEVSEMSDVTGVSEDSVYHSPNEDELDDDGQASSFDKEGNPSPRRLSIQEAIEQARIDLSKMALDDNDVSADRRESTTLKINISGAANTESVMRNDSPVVYDDEEFNFSRAKLRKSSSLKASKTPPGTPGRKKAVRFADAMGLDLESVRHVLSTGSPPRIPASAMADLRAGINEDRKEVGSTYMCPNFSQPGASGNFFQRVNIENVCVENAVVTGLTITGIVRVKNIAFHKAVRVRYSHNNWATFHDIAASYVQDSCDGPTDRFSFSIVAPPYFTAGSKLQFAVSYNAGGFEYWDSNHGHNYTFECFAKTVPTAAETSWMHFV